MSSCTSPRLQLGLFGGEEPLPVVLDEPTSPAPPRREPREVSAEREGRAAQVPMAISLDPPDIEGWQDELGRQRPHLVPHIDEHGVAFRWTCSAIEDWRRREDGAIGPCPWGGCPRNLLLDPGAPITIGGRRHAELVINRAGKDAVMGRRPSLPAVPSEGEVDEFALHAIARLDELPETCVVDVNTRFMSHTAGLAAIDAEEEIGGVETEDEEDRAIERAAYQARMRQNIDAVRVREIALYLGVSEEQVRLDTLSGAAKLGIRMVNGQPRAGDGARVEAMLAKIDGRRAVPTDDEIEERAVRVLSFMGWRARRGAVASADVARVLLTDTSPPPVAIRRIEREAPPPREASADEIFTF